MVIPFFLSVLLFRTVKDCDIAIVATIVELNKLVEQNFLSRDYYEVFSRSEKSPCYIINYNTEDQVLLISNDPGSGWSYILEATPQQLKEIAEKRLTLAQIAQLLKAVPESSRRNYPNG